MPMRVDQIGALQQFPIAKNVVGRTFRGQAAGIEYVAAIRDVGEIVKIVRGNDHGLRSAAPFDQKIDELALAARIEARGGFVEQQHRWIEHQHAGERHALLFSAR